MIADNTSLTSVFGLQSLSGIGGYLNINGNSLLDNVTALHNVGYVAGNMWIYENPNLCQSEAFDLYNAINAQSGVGGTPSIYSNDGGC